MALAFTLTDAACARADTARVAAAMGWAKVFG
ncbi:hypothetical protein FHX57_007279 [Paraburkholderia tropica]|nr:hypothetical protein [Paraburkholderia tropica]MBB3004892.1 hypothetical protein [Paraburkholderia tropica]MBB6323965.1 hypothetical protein [Paraburkholderia tropica]